MEQANTWFQKVKIPFFKDVESADLSPSTTQKYAGIARNVESLVKESKQLDWQEGVTIKESISTDDGGADFITKTTYDVYQGRENFPLLYKGIYTTTVDANYPEVIVANEMGAVEVVFLSVLEGEGVRFGRLAPSTQKTITFYDYAGGIEITQKMVNYNQTWNITEIAVAFGEAYNKMLNHLHLSPIIDGTYVTTGGGIATQKTTQEAGTAQLVAWNTDLKTTLRNALQILPRGTIMLINSSDRYAIEDAIATSFYGSDTKTTSVPTVVQTQLKKENIIAYDGEEVVVGDKTYPYNGVTAGFMYLIVPKRNFKELIKTELQLQPLSANPARLMAGGQVGVTSRATYLTLGTKYGAVKVDIAA